MEQLYLRDNDLGNEAADALYFLAQSKKNLWRIQVEKNNIRYGTLIDIEKECKRNKRNLYHGRQGMFQEIRQEISELASNQVPYVLFNALNDQITA